jgi:hypothetical protein
MLFSSEKLSSNFVREATLAYGEGTSREQPAAVALSAVDTRVKKHRTKGYLLISS